MTAGIKGTIDWVGYPCGKAGTPIPPTPPIPTTAARGLLESTGTAGGYLVPTEYVSDPWPTDFQLPKPRPDKDEEVVILLSILRLFRRW